MFCLMIVTKILWFLQILLKVEAFYWLFYKRNPSAQVDICFSPCRIKQCVDSENTQSSPRTSMGWVVCRGNHELCLAWAAVGLCAWLFSQWGRETNLCAGNLTIIGSDDGLSPDRRQVIIWTNAGMWLFGPWGRNFSDIPIAIHIF